MFPLIAKEGIKQILLASGGIREIVEMDSKNTSDHSENKEENQTNSGNARELNLDLSLALPNFEPQRNRTSQNIQGINFNEPNENDRKHQDRGKGKAKVQQDEKATQIARRKQQALEVQNGAGPSTLHGGLLSSSLRGQSPQIQRPQQTGSLATLLQKLNDTTNQRQTSPVQPPTYLTPSHHYQLPPQFPQTLDEIQRQKQRASGNYRPPQFPQTLDEIQWVQQIPSGNYRPPQFPQTLDEIQRQKQIPYGNYIPIPHPHILDEIQQQQQRQSGNYRPIQLPQTLDEIQRQQQRASGNAQVIMHQPINYQAQPLNTAENLNIRPQINRNPTIPLALASGNYYL
uniref:Uncharacterized protein n=1 Tax=Meloidogyne javanica TaxID=6303 RepID=A0A915M4Y3_MELJA